MAEDIFLTPAQLAKKLNCSLATVYRLISSGRLKRAVIHLNRKVTRIAYNLAIEELKHAPEGPVSPILTKRDEPINIKRRRPRSHAKSKVDAPVDLSDLAGDTAPADPIGLH